MDGYFYQYIIGRVLGVFYKYSKISIIMKQTGINQFKFRIVSAPAFIFINQPTIRVFALRVFVQHFLVRMCWRVVEVIIKFFYIFAMISLRVSQTKISFLDDGVFFVP